MSGGAEAPGAGAAPGGRWRAIVAAGLIGMAAGLAWGISDQPRYTATASVIAAEGAGGNGAELDRYAELGRSAKVADAAAEILGDDVPGADLLADVDLEPAPDGAALVIAASAEQPDFAAAAADGYAEALVRVAAAKSDDGKPLELGAEAALPASPSENRSGLLWAALGLLAGLILGALAALGWRRPGDDPRRRERIAEALGTPLLGSSPDPASAVRADGDGRLRLLPAGIAPFREMVDRLDLGGSEAPRTVAVVPAISAEGSGHVAMAVAVAAAEIGLRTLLVECPGASPAIATRIDVEPAPGLGDYLAGAAEPGDVLRTVSIEAGAGGPFSLVFLPAGLAEEAEDPPAAARARLGRLVARLARVYELVVFAAPVAGAGGYVGAIIGRVEGVVLVAADDGSSDGDLQRARGPLGPAHLLGVVVAGGGGTE